MDIPEPIVVAVSGETFKAAADPSQPGAWHLDWVSGPNEGYGFTTRSADHCEESPGELERAAQSFLDMIDPQTGYIRE